MTSLRPIVVLNALRKTLSLVVHKRTADNVDAFLSQGQGGFRHGRSTAYVVLGYRWQAATMQRFQSSVHVLGIDMSPAFDTIRRDKLITVLQYFGESELRIIRMLLAETTLEPRLKQGKFPTFICTIGTPQADSISPVLFVIYLEAALRDLWDKLPQRPREDTEMLYYMQARSQLFARGFHVPQYRLQGRHKLMRGHIFLIYSRGRYKFTWRSYEKL